MKKKLMFIVYVIVFMYLTIPAYPAPNIVCEICEECKEVCNVQQCNCKEDAQGKIKCELCKVCKIVCVKKQCCHPVVEKK